MQYFEKIASTQIEAKKQIDIKKIILDDVIFTNEQFSGISTKKNFPWISQKGDLNISIIKNIKEMKKNGNLLLNHLPFCASIATNDAIIEICDKITLNNLKIFFKWPNDLLLYNKNSDIKYKKICGILCEVYKEHFIIGIGLNLISFPEKTEHFKATSIEKETGVKLNNLEIANTIITHFNYNIKQIQKYGFNIIKNKWKKNAYMIGEKILLKNNGQVIFKDITDDGYIIAINQTGEKQIIISSDDIIGSCVQD